MYVKCQEPFDATGCQENSVYLAGAGQFGCCGACVTFKSKYYTVGTWNDNKSIVLLDMVDVNEIPVYPTHTGYLL